MSLDDASFENGFLGSGSYCQDITYGFESCELKRNRKYEEKKKKMKYIDSGYGLSGQSILWNPDKQNICCIKIILGVLFVFGSLQFRGTLLKKISHIRTNTLTGTSISILYNNRFIVRIFWIIWLTQDLSSLPDPKVRF